MKRERFLHLLTHDHHHALVAALRVKEWLQGYPAEDQIPTPLKESVLRFFMERLEKHFREEEQYLLPYCGEVPEEKALEGRLEEDHRELRRIREKQTAGEWLEWAKLLREHIRWEEEFWFPFLEKKIPQDEKERLKAIFQEQRSNEACPVPRPGKKQP